MHLGKSYRLTEFLVWTRRNIYVLLVLGLVPVLLYQVAGLKWLTLPLTVVTLLGTATAFVVGFKNVQTYARTLEAQKAWVAILSISRYWGVISRYFVADAERSRVLVDRHLAWLTALRYQLRSTRIWETVDNKANAEYQKHYVIPERQQPLDAALSRYLSPQELQAVLRADNKAAYLMGLQGREVRQLLDEGLISGSDHADFNARIRECLDLQGQVERIKSFPYPRQYAIINTFFVRSFCFLLPFGLLTEFDKLNEHIGGVMQGRMIWLVVPFSMIISWIYTSLEQVGESTENPFEGSPNDVPISHLSAVIERDMRQMQDHPDLPVMPAVANEIVL